MRYRTSLGDDVEIAECRFVDGVYDAGDDLAAAHNIENSPQYLNGHVWPDNTVNSAETSGGPSDNSSDSNS